MDYAYIKLIHLFAVVLFLGNIITGVFWMRFAVRSSDLKIISHTIYAIIRLDRYFTIPGVVIITAFGILAAINGQFPILHTGWILWSIILFSVSGLAFGWKVAPLQKKIWTLTKNKEALDSADQARFDTLYKEWDIWALVATLTPLAAFVLMILKIPA